MEKEKETIKQRLKNDYEKYIYNEELHRLYIIFDKVNKEEYHKEQQEANHYRKEAIKEYIVETKRANIESAAITKAREKIIVKYELDENFNFDVVV